MAEAVAPSLTDRKTSGPTSPRGREGLGATERKDAWWAGPLATAIGLGAFGIYATFRAFYNADYQYENVLSPFYAPLLPLPSWVPAWFSPAFLILWAPGGFRLTCYYYRKAYYRAFLLDPPGCAVGEPKSRRYSGETSLFLFQNLHRYFLYVALAFLLILAYDSYLALFWSDGFHVSIGTLVLFMNTALLSLYTLSCHSFRHLVGGKVDCFSTCPMGQSRYRAWRAVSSINDHHMLFAWLSLFMVGFADFYVWMVASGTITDLRLF